MRSLLEQIVLVGAHAVVLCVAVVMTVRLVWG